IRAGSDIAFLGGLVNYAIQNNRLAKDYLVNYTNAAFVVKEGFKLPEDGLYSGFDSAAKTYDKSTWNYEEGGNVGPKTSIAGVDSSAGTPGQQPAKNVEKQSPVVASSPSTSQTAKSGQVEMSKGTGGG